MIDDAGPHRFCLMISEDVPPGVGEDSAVGIAGMSAEDVQRGRESLNGCDDLCGCAIG